MAKKTKQPAKRNKGVTDSDLERMAIKAGLDRAVRRERTIQRLSKQLGRAFRKSNDDRLQLAADIASDAGYRLQIMPPPAPDEK